MFHVVFCIILLVIYMYAVADQLPWLGKRERAYLSAIVYLLLCGFCSERFPLLLGASYGLRYFNVALPAIHIIILSVFIAFKGTNFNMLLTKKLWKGKTPVLKHRQIFAH